MSPRVASGPRLEELVTRAKARDDHAFEELVRATYADAFSLALRLTGDEHDARDAVQEAYLRAYRAIPRFRGDSSFSTWMYRITANCSSTLLERRGRAPQVTLDALTPPEREAQFTDHRPDFDPEARSVGLSERARLAAAIEELPDRLRAVLVLRDIYDLPHDAIASELGISVTAAKVRLHRARRQLRDRLFPPPVVAQVTAETPARLLHRLSDAEVFVGRAPDEEVPRAV